MFSPAFGKADLSNCERELIHLAGSVQPHGALLALREADLLILLASRNAPAMLGRSLDGLLGQPLATLGSGFEQPVRRLLAEADLAEPVPLACALDIDRRRAGFEGMLHRAPGALLLEVEPLDAAGGVPAIEMPGPQLLEQMRAAVQRLSQTSSIGALADALVRAYRELVGYDRVMVYQFDPDGHGKIIAEARDPRLDSLLDHHYPASDIPQRARELYLRTRLRVLVDVGYTPAPLVPQRLPGSDEELDMSLCHLRSMSPLHLQYLKNMGVTATLVASLVRDGRLWGLVACHHDTPRNLRFALRTAADLLAEIASTRIAAIENYAHAQVAIQVRRLEQRLVEATSTEGDWRLALFRNPRTLLQPLEATGAALFHDGEVLSAGEVPSTPQLRALMHWVDAQPTDGAPFACASVARANPELEPLTPVASGVLAVKLSASRPEYLMWFRKEQLLSVTWAGDPSKPAVGDDPLELSPRRSFAAWSEIVRGTALPWTPGEIAVARAFGVALVDIIVQIHAVKLLIAEHQLGAIRTSLAASKEPVMVVDARCRALFVNDAFCRLAGYGADVLQTCPDLAGLFDRPQAAQAMLDALTQDRQSWRGKLGLRRAAGDTLPVAVRAEAVPSRDGTLLGLFLIFDDLSDQRRAEAARQHLEEALTRAGEDGRSARSRDSRDSREGDELIAAILANASLAAMDIADANQPAGVAPLLQELEVSTRRAATLYERLRSFNPPR